MCKPLINTSDEKYDDTSDYHDEDVEVIFQYGTSAWTSDPHTGSGAVIAIVSRSVRSILFL